MIRQLIIAAIAVSASAPWMAKAQSIRFAEEESPASASQVVPEISFVEGVGPESLTIAPDATEQRPGDVTFALDELNLGDTPVVEPASYIGSSAPLWANSAWTFNPACCHVWGTPVYPYNSAVRFGWWAVESDGSETKTGEFQDLEPSPFWDVDFITSDGVRTWDVALSGLDNEANDARVYYYGPGMSADVEYERYLRRLDHDPLTGYDLDNPIPPGPDDNVVSQDLNVGEDYAIRVEELDARFKGRWNNHISWQLNLWGQRKFGERQANATAHCFDIDAGDPPGNQNNTCHVLSQRQTIDWLTMEIKPVIEAEFKNVTVEYSRTMRSFDAGDGTVTRQYTHFDDFSPANDILGPDYNYAIVPDNYTQIDRLKIGARLSHNTQFYGNLYYGDTKNKFRDMHRTFGGYDLRLINSSYHGLNLTGYASMYDEDTDFPPFFLDAPPLAPANTYDEESLRQPIDRTRTRAGVRASWNPFLNPYSRYPNYGWKYGTSWMVGYEYYQLERKHAVYDVEPIPPGPFRQPNTITHEIAIGPTTRWNPCLDSYIRYKVQFVHVPLIGVSEYSEDDPDVQGLFNTKLPEQAHIVEIGGTWMPRANFLTTMTFSMVNSWNNSEYANFTEDDYPITVTVWYAPTCRLSFTGSYAYYSNWIDQDITLGTNRGDPTETETTRWNYAGENHLFNVNMNYAWTPCVQFVAGYEWDRGSNVFSVPTSPHAADGVDWSLLPSLSDVIVETQRLTAGVDWQPNCHMDLYLRYILYDYDDIGAGLDSGTAHMALAGGSVIW